MSYRETFADPAEFWVAVANASINGFDQADPRLEFSAASGLASGEGAAGGFTVPETVAEQLWQTVYDTGQILSRCTAQPVTRGDTLRIPAIDESSRAQGSRFGGARMYWVDEGETATASRPKYRELALHPKKLLGFSYATEELLADAPALAAWLERTFGLEASFEIEDAIVNGTGAGKPLGIVNSDAVIEVAKEGGQAADTVLAANFEAMMARLWGPSRRRAIWLTNNDVMLQAEGLSLSNGSPLTSYDAEGNPRILGRPVALTEYTPAVGDRGDIVLADLSQYLVAEIAPSFLSSLHVRFIDHEGVFRIRYRVDGQPAWSSPLTPKNSSTTQSPLVTLAERA